MRGEGRSGTRLLESLSEGFAGSIFSFVKVEVNCIDLNGSIDKVIEGVEVKDRCKGMLNFWLEAFSEESDTAIFIRAKESCKSLKFRGKFGSGTCLFKGKESTAQFLTALFIRIHRGQLLFECIIIVEEF